MSSAMHNGKFYGDVNFVDSPEEAELEILFDEISYDKKSNSWLYFYHGHLVATIDNNNYAKI